MWITKPLVTFSISSSTMYVCCCPINEWICSPLTHPCCLSLSHHMHTHTHKLMNKTRNNVKLTFHYVLRGNGLNSIPDNSFFSLHPFHFLAPPPAFVSLLLANRITNAWGLSTYSGLTKIVLPNFLLPFQFSPISLLRSPCPSFSLVRAFSWMEHIKMVFSTCAVIFHIFK